MKKTMLSTAMIACLALPGTAMAADGPPTFTKDVLPIMQENCQTCHRPSGTNLSGMIAPMSLMTYQEVRPWARAIARVVDSGEMPPWHASEEQNGIFRNERTLTDEEAETILSWVNSGARRGNPQDAPAPVNFSETGWNFGEPDMVVEFPEPYFVEDEVEDLYHDVTAKLSEEQLPEDKWIRGIEFKPGSEVVHHIIGHAFAPGEVVDREAEEGTGNSMIGGNAPGADQVVYEDGFGIELKKGSTIMFAMHYHKESGPGTGVWDNSKMGVQFQENEVQHPVTIDTIAHREFEIPPNVGNWRVGASKTFEEDTLITQLMPHMHLRGAYAKYTAYYPDGTSEELLEVPEYDFNWQSFYQYDVMKEIPAGTRIEVELAFNNSPQQAEYAGFNSDRAIRFGGPTTDEMDLGWIFYAPKKPVNVSALDTGAENTGD